MIRWLQVFLPENDTGSELSHPGKRHRIGPVIQRVGAPKHLLFRSKMFGGGASVRERSPWDGGQRVSSALATPLLMETSPEARCGTELVSTRVHTHTHAQTSQTEATHSWGWKWPHVCDLSPHLHVISGPETHQRFTLPTACHCPDPAAWAATQISGAPGPPLQHNPFPTAAPEGPLACFCAGTIMSDDLRTECLRFLSARPPSSLSVPLLHLRSPSRVWRGPP